jgi:hypothetical protein
MSLVFVESAAAILAEKLIDLILELLLDVLMACASQGSPLRSQEALMLSRGALLQGKK